MTNTNLTAKNEQAGAVETRAKTIIEQLGGRAIFAMAFSRCGYCAADHETGAGVRITFDVAPALRRSTRDKITHVVVTLDADDTYSVDFLSKRGLDYRDRGRSSGIYADQLRPLVEAATGLRMTLGTMGRAS